MKAQYCTSRYHNVNLTNNEYAAICELVRHPTLLNKLAMEGKLRREIPWWELFKQGKREISLMKIGKSAKKKRRQKLERELRETSKRMY